jgi:hypothetical protein
MRAFNFSSLCNLRVFCVAVVNLRIHNHSPREAQRTWRLHRDDVKKVITGVSKEQLTRMSLSVVGTRHGPEIDGAIEFAPRYADSLFRLPVSHPKIVGDDS